MMFPFSINHSSTELHSPTLVFILYFMCSRSDPEICALFIGSLEVCAFWGTGNIMRCCNVQSKFSHFMAVKLCNPVESMSSAQESLWFTNLARPAINSIDRQGIQFFCLQYEFYHCFCAAVFPDDPSSSVRGECFILQNERKKSEEKGPLV